MTIWSNFISFLWKSSSSDFWPLNPSLSTCTPSPSKTYLWFQAHVVHLALHYFGLVCVTRHFLKYLDGWDRRGHEVIHTQTKNSSKLKYGANRSFFFFFRIFFSRQTKIYNDDFLRQHLTPSSSSPVTCLTTSATLLVKLNRLWTAAVQGLRDVISMYVMIGPARVEGRVGPCNAL